MKVSEISGIVKGKVVREGKTSKKQKIGNFIGMHNKGKMVIANIKIE